jgi:hypothetical protein
MRTRDHDQNDQSHEPTVAGSSGGASPSGDEQRRRAQRLLDLGDETISQALSQDSERFLSQNRQQGGQ